MKDLATLICRDQSPKNLSAFTPQSCPLEIDNYFHCVCLNCHRLIGGWHENTIQGRGEKIPILLPDPALLTQRQLHVKSSGSLPKLPMLEFSPLQTLRGHLFSHPYDKRIHHT